MHQSSSRRRRLFRPLIEGVEERVVPSFLAGLAFDAGSQPRAVAIGEFNGDGFADFAVANVGPGSLSVLLGNGDASFQVARTTYVGGRPESIAVGDVNQDGLMDLAVAYASPSSVSVLLGNGDGTFQDARHFPAGITPASVVIEDYSGPRKLDHQLSYSGGPGKG